MLLDGIMDITRKGLVDHQKGKKEEKYMKLVRRKLGSNIEGSYFIVHMNRILKE